MTTHKHRFKLDSLKLVPLSDLLKQYGTTPSLLKQNLLMLGLESQEVNGEDYLTLEQASKLEAFYSRLQLSWAISLLLGLDQEFKGI